MKEMAKIICGYRAVGGNYNSPWDREAVGMAWLFLDLASVNKTVNQPLIINIRLGRLILYGAFV
jgi:hypothetical protein